MALPASSIENMVSTLITEDALQAGGRVAHTKTVVFPDICLHTDSIKCVLPEKCKPCLHRLWVSILDLNQSTEGDSFEVLLTLLVHEVASGYGPAFNDAGERHRPGHREVEVVSGTNGKVREELHVTDAVGSQLKVADWKAVFHLPPQRP